MNNQNKYVDGKYVLKGKLGHRTIYFIKTTMEDENKKSVALKATHCKYSAELFDSYEDALETLKQLPEHLFQIYSALDVYDNDDYNPDEDYLSFLIVSGKNNQGDLS